MGTPRWLQAGCRAGCHSLVAATAFCRLGAATRCHLWLLALSIPRYFLWGHWPCHHPLLALTPVCNIFKFQVSRGALRLPPQAGGEAEGPTARSKCVQLPSPY